MTTKEILQKLLEEFKPGGKIWEDGDSGGPSHGFALLGGNFQPIDAGIIVQEFTTKDSPDGQVMIEIGGLDYEEARFLLSLLKKINLCQ